MKKVYVSQEGRFLVARLEDGTDVSNKIDRSVRRVALDKGYVMYNFKTNESQFDQTAEVDEPVELEMSNDPEHNKIKQYIHSSASIKPAELFMSDIKWKYLVRSAMRGRNIMMVGPAGSGKTMAVKYLVNATNRPHFYFNLGATQDPRAVLVGNTHFNKDTGTYFSESLFIKAIQTENAVILLDELSRAHPEAWNILMTVLDQGQRYLRLDEADGAPTITVANGVTFIATANVGNEYTSTRVMDRALLDRFTVIEMDTLDKDEEFKLLKQRYPEVANVLLTAVAEITATTRKECRASNPKLTSSISTRAAVEIASLLHDGFSLAESAEVAIYPFFSEDGGAESERTYVKQIVQKYCVDPTTAEEDLFSTDEVSTDAETTPF